MKDKRPKCKLCGAQHRLGAPHVSLSAAHAREERNGAGRLKRDKVVNNG